MFLCNSLFALFSTFSIVSAFVIGVPPFLFSNEPQRKFAGNKAGEGKGKNFGADFFCLLFGGLRAKICFSFGCECSSVGRASPCQGECREFESLHSLHFFALFVRLRGVFSSWLRTLFLFFDGEGSRFGFADKKEKSGKKSAFQVAEGAAAKRFFGGFAFGN